jgi:hypothetical protein
MKTYQLVWGLIFVMALCSFAEDDDDDKSPIGTVNTKDGVLVFSNKENDFFTFKLEGKNPNAFMKGGNFFVNVNNKGFQYNVVSFNDFLSPEEMKNKNDSIVLQKHLKFELKYIEENLKTHLDLKVENKKCKNGRIILVWSFTMPQKAENAKKLQDVESVKKQLFISTITKNHVLVLNGIIVKEKDYNEFYKILVNGMNSLRLKETATDPDAMEDSLMQKK